MADASRVLAILRESGPAGLADRVLERTVLRRLAFFSREAVGRPPAEPRPGLEFSLLERREVDEFATELRPDMPAAVVHRRLDRGEVCLLGRFEGRAVHSRWLAHGRAEIGYLEHSFVLAPGVVYVYDSFTAPDARRTRAALSGPVLATARSQWPGVEWMLAAVWPGNAAGERLGSRLGYRPIGTIASIRLGHRHLRLWRRIEPGFLGEARPLD